MMAAITCSMMNSVTPVARMRSTSAIIACSSWGVNPAMTSSSRNSCGDVARPRATSSRLRSEMVRLRPSRSRLSASPTKSRTSSARRRAAFTRVSRHSAPIITFCSTGMLAKGLVIWKVRHRPMRAMISGLSPAISRPSNERPPDLGRRKPVMTLKSVVLPAPFGPINPTTSPRSIEKLMSCRTRLPPNHLLTFATSSRAVIRGPPAGRGAPSGP